MERLELHPKLYAGLQVAAQKKNSRRGGCPAVAKAQLVKKVIIVAELRSSCQDLCQPAGRAEEDWSVQFAMLLSWVHAAFFHFHIVNPT